MFKIEINPYRLRFKKPAGTSRGTYKDHQIWYVVFQDDEDPTHFGIGECAPLYDLSPDFDAGYVDRLATFCRITEKEQRINTDLLRDHPSILFGLETALRHYHQRSWQLWETPFSRGAEGITINGLIWMGDYPSMLQQIESALARGFHCVKLKIGAIDFERELALLRFIRSRYSAKDVELRVDANAGWSREQAVRYLHDLEALDVEMVEQPLAKDDIEGMGLVQKQTRIPVVADESVLTVKHVEALAAAGVAGINLKLQKAGGLTPILRMLKRGQELGLRIMLGCMIETSIGATAMAHLMGTAEWVDLDSPILITNDPFDGIQFADDCSITLPERAGIGVVSRT